VSASFTQLDRRSFVDEEIAPISFTSASNAFVTRNPRIVEKVHSHDECQGFRSCRDEWNGAASKLLLFLA
jgi:hypothetical protein